MTEEGDIVNFTSGSLAGDSYEILDLGEGSWSDTDTEEHTWFKVDESLKKS